MASDDELVEVELILGADDMATLDRIGQRCERQGGFEFSAEEIMRCLVLAMMRAEEEESADNPKPKRWQR